MSEQEKGQRRKRLLVVTSTYPRWESDSEPAFVHNLNRALAASYDVVVLAPHYKAARSEEVMDKVLVKRFKYAPERLERLVNEGGILQNLKRRPWTWALVPLFLARMFFAVLKELRTGSYDVIHCHWVLPQGLVLKLATSFVRRRLPVLMTSHGADLFALRGFPFSLLYRSSVRCADRLTVVSAPMKEMAARIGVNQDLISIEPMGVDFSVFSNDSCSPGKLHRGDSVKELLFVGRLVEKKGLRYLIDVLPDVIRDIPELRLTVVGDGPEMEALTSLVADHHLERYVDFKGALPSQSVAQLMRSRPVFVVPFVEARNGDVEGFGVVVLEALASGCPAVVGAVGATVSSYSDLDSVILVNARDRRELHSSLVEVLSRSERYYPSVSDTAVLKSRFDWSAVSHRYADLIESIVR